MLVIYHHKQTLIIMITNLIIENRVIVFILLLLINNFVILNQIISTKKAWGSDYRSGKIGTLTRRILLVRRIRAKFFSIHVTSKKILIPGKTGLFDLRYGYRNSLYWIK